MVDQLQAGCQLSRYRVGRLVRRDSVTVDYELDVGRDRPLALKEYLPAGLVERSEDDVVVPRAGVPPAVVEGGVERFLEQYRVLGGIRHPAIVRVRECFPERGTGYAVMYRVEGETLAARLAGRGMLSPEELRTILLPLLEGLELVHGVGLLHTSINLDNIVIQPDGSPVLLGFGAAKGATGPRRAFGARLPALAEDLTAGYAALEQYSHQGQLGPWTDVYALGAVAYRCMTGARPPDAPVRALQDDMVAASEAVDGNFERELPAAVDRALGLQVAGRPRTLAAWRRMLDAPKQIEARVAPGHGRLAARQFGRAVRDGAMAERAGREWATPEREVAHAARRGLVWAFPAVVAVTLMSVLTWVDTRVLRSAGARHVTAESTVLDLGTWEPAVSGTRRNAVQRPANTDRSRVTDPTAQYFSPEPVAVSATTVSEPARSAEDSGTRSRPGDPLRSMSEPGTDDGASRLAGRPSEHRQTGGADEREEAVDESGPVPEAPLGVVREQVDAEAMAGARQGTLTLDLLPGSAEVEFLDRPEVSYRAGLTVAEGRHRLRVSSPGRLPATRTVEVTGATHVRIELPPEPAPFLVATIPPGGQVLLSEGVPEYSPRMLLPPGDYPVAVTLRGYEPWEGAIAHGTEPTNREIVLRRSTAGFADPLASGGVGPLMVIVPPGDFTMGCVSRHRCLNNEFPLLDRTIEAAFAISKFEITVADFERFAGPVARDADGSPGRTEPMVDIAWESAVAYTDWLSSESGRTYRLPTEREWEYAARAGTSTAYSWGNEPGDGLARCSGCGSLAGAEGAVAVGSFAANPWGLHDMHGNVWEWVLDCPTGWQLRDDEMIEGRAATCQSRVRRGGSWEHSPRRMRSASRNVTNPGLRSANTGFRVLLELQ